MAGKTVFLLHVDDRWVLLERTDIEASAVPRAAAFSNNREVISNHKRHEQQVSPHPPTMVSVAHAAVTAPFVCVPSIFDYLFCSLK
jgi:hypothetical protein